MNIQSEIEFFSDLALAHRARLQSAYRRVLSSFATPWAGVDPQRHLSQRIVDALEAIEIEKRDGQRRP